MEMGKETTEMTRCRECRGTGRLHAGEITSLGVVQMRCACPYCAGTGTTLPIVVKNLEDRIAELERQVKALAAHIDSENISEGGWGSVLDDKGQNA